MFFFKLSHLISTDTYNFLHFSSYLDLHLAPSQQILTPTSVLLFLLNNEDHDYALLAVDLLTKRLILYDCLGAPHGLPPRPKDTFLLHVKNLRRFLVDYFDHIPMRQILDESMMGASDKEIKKELQLD